MARKKWHGNLVYYKGAISKLDGKNGLLNKWSWDDGWLSGKTKTGSTLDPIIDCDEFQLHQ